MHQPTEPERITASSHSPGISEKPSKHRLARAYDWLEVTLIQADDLKMAERYCLEYLTRSSSCVWQEPKGAYQRTVLEAHGLAKPGVFVAFPYYADLARRWHVTERYVRELTEGLEEKGYIRRFKNAGGLGAMQRSSRPTLFVIDTTNGTPVPNAAPAMEPQFRETEPQFQQTEPEFRETEPEFPHISSVPSVSSSLSATKKERESIQPELELIFTAVLSECDDKNQKYAEKAAKELSALGVQPEQLAGFNAWWHGTGRTFAVSPNVIVNHYETFVAFKESGETGSTVGLTPTATTEAGWQRVLNAARHDRYRVELTFKEELAAQEIGWHTLKQANDWQIKDLKKAWLAALASQLDSYEQNPPDAGNSSPYLWQAWERTYPEAAATWEATRRAVLSDADAPTAFDADDAPTAGVPEWLSQGIREHFKKNSEQKEPATQ